MFLPPKSRRRRHGPKSRRPWRWDSRIEPMVRSLKFTPTVESLFIGEVSAEDWSLSTEWWFEAFTGLLLLRAFHVKLKVVGIRQGMSGAEARQSFASVHSIDNIPRPPCQCEM